MQILAIETSCDETAISIVEGNGNFKRATFNILGNTLFSQAKLHQKYGGVYPNLAKREHVKNLIPLLIETLKEAHKYTEDASSLSDTQKKELTRLLEREKDLCAQLISALEHIRYPDIDAIAVTYGPGLEPALWVGINFAQALSMIWNIPLIPINHMEGHILSSFLKENTIEAPGFPALALLISGGHTELVVMDDFLSYTIVGQTRDDALGEAFDKVARMLDLPYPGGPEISRLAQMARERKLESVYRLPRPMIDSDDLDFSFSGLKTAVLYTLKNIPEVTEEIKMDIAREFEEAVADVLCEKTSKAIEMYRIKTLAIGGGVSANTHLREIFKQRVEERHKGVDLYIPDQTLTGDNAIMIAVAAYYRLYSKTYDAFPLRAIGNLSL